MTMSAVPGQLYTIPPLMMNFDREDVMYCRIANNETIVTLQNIVEVYHDDVLLCVDVKPMHSDHYHSRSGKLIRLNDEFTYRMVELDSHV